MCFPTFSLTHSTLRGINGALSSARSVLGTECRIDEETNGETNGRSRFECFSVYAVIRDEKITRAMRAQLARTKDVRFNVANR